MFIEEAMSILGIHTYQEVNLDQEVLDLAFNKMIKRYPPEFFPEMSGKIRFAYQRLLQGQEYWLGVIYEKNSLQDDGAHYLEVLRTNAERDFLGSHNN